VKKTKKRHKLAEGYIWFSSDVRGPYYTHVSLTTLSDGRGGCVPIKIGKLGGWQKVKLYAEYTE
jgi:hypothetical protein